MKNLILIGGGGHCVSCIDVIENLNKYKISGIVDNKKNEQINYPLIGMDEDLQKIRLKFNTALITLGHIKDPTKRINLYKKIIKLNFKLPIIISKNAYKSKKSNIGIGSIIMHNVVVNAYSNIGVNCIVNTGAIIEHGSLIDDHCHISTGAIINGDVKINKNTFIGSNSVIKEGIIIGKNCIIGAGVFVKKNVKDYQVLTK